MYPFQSHYENTICSADGGADTHIWNAGTAPDTLWHSNSWISLEASFTVYCQERGLPLSGINNNTYLLFSTKSKGWSKSYIYFFSIRPLSSSSVWQTATLGRISMWPLAESPLLLVNSSAKLVVFFSNYYYFPEAGEKNRGEQQQLLEPSIYSDLLQLSGTDHHLCL